MARPTKLTPETQERIVNAISTGATYELAAGYGGISYAGFNQWMNRGMAEIERVDKARLNIEIRDSEKPFVEFFNAVKAAEARAAVGWLAKIEKAASDGSWQAAAWKLERRYPREYGKTVQEQQHSGSVRMTWENVMRANPDDDDSDSFA